MRSVDALKGSLGRVVQLTRNFTSETSLRSEVVEAISAALEAGWADPKKISQASSRAATSWEHATWPRSNSCARLTRLTAWPPWKSRSTCSAHWSFSWLGWCLAMRPSGWSSRSSTSSTMPAPMLARPTNKPSRASCPSKLRCAKRRPITSLHATELSDGQIHSHCL